MSGSLVGLPGYKPRGKRPRCLRCNAELRPFTVHKIRPGSKTWKYELVGVRYGPEGNGRFCTYACALGYALQRAGGPIDHTKGD